MKMYIAVLDEVPDFIVPTLVAHTVLSAHVTFFEHDDMSVFDHYMEWFENSYKKCVIRVNQKEFDKIAALPHTYLGHESKTLDGKKCCAIPLPCPNEVLPNVLKFAKLWQPN